MEIEWVKENDLARSSRPGYGVERYAQVASEVVDQWIQAVRDAGVRSVICLLNDDQLPLYSSLPEPLPKYYESQGLEVRHVPITDHQRPPVTSEDLEKIWEAYQTLQKPVLIHCSAGIDRTGAAVRHIQERRSFLSG